jgi:hypothetical protein
MGGELPGQEAAGCVEFARLLYPFLVERFDAARWRVCGSPI